MGGWTIRQLDEHSEAEVRAIVRLIEQDAERAEEARREQARGRRR
jgi:hypothetical protein